MFRKACLAIIAVALAVGLWVSLNKKKPHNECSDFELLEPVEIASGYNQGATGVVMHQSQGPDGQCLYNVRGQRGVEMPFTEWYESWELYPTGE